MPRKPIADFLEEEKERKLVLNLHIASPFEGDFTLSHPSPIYFDEK